MFVLLSLLGWACKKDKNTEEEPDLLVFEDEWLDVPYDDAMDPRTMKAVLGLRHIEPLGATEVRLEFGASWSNFEPTPYGFEIYSPNDSNYEFDSFVHPTSVEVFSEGDVFVPFGRHGEYLVQNHVYLTLPYAMKEGKTYYIRAIGGNPQEGDVLEEYHNCVPWFGWGFTDGQNARGFKYGSSKREVSDKIVENIMGLRGIQKVGPNMYRIRIGAAVDEDALQDTSMFDINGLHPTNIHRISEAEATLPGLHGVYPFSVRLQHHDLYLEFDTPPASGSNNTVTISDSIVGGRNSLDFSANNMINPHIHVNQEGYFPDVTEKRALFGAWMGTGGSLLLENLPTCELRKTSDDSVVWDGQLTLRHRLGEGGEGPYNVDESGEEVYLCDFGDYTKTGEYYINIPEYGRSYDFRIAKDVFDRTSSVTMWGVLWQRSGIGLEGTGSQYKKAIGHSQYKVRIPYMEDRVIIGGHYDAGDYNPRLHWIVAANMMLAWDWYPQKSGDGTFAVPEGINGIPDILDEAAWSLQPLIQLQSPEGGIGSAASEGGDATPIESMYDANFVETPERECIIEHSFDLDPTMSFILAALTAQASDIWSTLGEEQQLQAEKYLLSAKKAYRWAKENGSMSGSNAAWAALAMARATGDSDYILDFMDTGYNFTGADDDIWGIYAATAYLRLPKEFQDDTTVSQYEEAFVHMARNWYETGMTRAYPRIHHPYNPTNWGAAAYPVAPEPIFIAHAIENSAESKLWLQTSVDMMLGLNPLNKTWIVGLGDEPIFGPAHITGWSTYQGIMPPGIQVEGPFYQATDSWLSNTVPSLSSRPTLYKYIDINYVFPMNEPVMRNISRTAMMMIALRSDQ